MTGVDYSGLSKRAPYKALVHGTKKWGGRSRSGRVTVRHRGGGNKRRSRIVDFRGAKLGIPGKVEALEYDPMRTAFLARILYRDGDRRYVLAAHGLHAGDEVVAAEKAPLQPGNRMWLAHVPIGTEVHNIELMPGKGGQMVRSAGSSARVLAHDGPWVHLVFPSSEIHRVRETAFATVGAVSNAEHKMVVIGKAGRKRWRGRRPYVRGAAMNPVDHPHGGGEGRAPVGMKHPKTRWGKPAFGVKTRKRNKASNTYIVQGRKRR